MMCSGQTECHPVSETWLTYVHLYYLRQEVHHETSPPGLNAMSRQSQLVSVWRFPSSVQSRLPTQCFSKYDCRPHSLHYQGTSFNYICPGNLQNQNFCVLRPRNPHFKQALHKCFRMFDSGRKKKKKVLKWPACCAILYKGSCSQTLLQVGITRVVFKMLMPGSHSQILGSNRNREHRWFSKLPGPFYSAVKFRSHCTRAHPLTPPTLPAVYLRSIY